MTSTLLFSFFIFGRSSFRGWKVTSQNFFWGLIMLFHLLLDFPGTIIFFIDLARSATKRDKMIAGTEET